jgi:hypothetical protein
MELPGFDPGWEWVYALIGLLLCIGVLLYIAYG